MKYLLIIILLASCSLEKKQEGKPYDYSDWMYDKYESSVDTTGLAEYNSLELSPNKYDK